MKRFYDLNRKRPANVWSLSKLYLYFLKQKFCRSNPATNIMQVDVLFDFAKVYNINTFDVVKGQKFLLLSDLKVPSRWFSDQDPVLSMKVKDNSAEVEATSIGQSSILIMGIDLQKIYEIKINVVESIARPATDLGLTAGDPVLKK